MPRYRIEQKIWTVAEIQEPQTIEGFHMRAIDTDAGDGSWLATDEVDGSDFISAFNLSRPRLVG